MKKNVLIGLIETINWAKKGMFCARFDLGSIPDDRNLFNLTIRDCLRKEETYHHCDQTYTVSKKSFPASICML